MTENLAALEARVDAEDASTRARLARPDALSKAAGWYAANGFAIFPLRPGGKAPATTHGLHDASTDAEVIRDWWTATPLANIGLRTGLTYDVIDVDVPDGYLSLNELKAADLVPPILGRVVTARNGMHLYIAADPEAGNWAGKFPGIDYRGINGYVVAPPSRSEVGMWVWTTPLDLAG